MCSNGMEANFFFDPPEFIETRRDVLLACSEIHLEASLATSPPTHHPSCLDNARPAPPTGDIRARDRDLLTLLTRVVAREMREMRRSRWGASDGV